MIPLPRFLGWLTGSLFKRSDVYGILAPAYSFFRLGVFAVSRPHRESAWLAFAV